VLTSHGVTGIPVDPPRRQTISGKETDVRNRSNVERAGEVFAQHGQEIYRMILFHISSDPQIDADDVYQNLFLSLVEKPLPSDTRNPRQYLYRAVANDVIDIKRRKQAYRRRVTGYAESRRAGATSPNGGVDVAEREEIERFCRLIRGTLCPHEAQAVIRTCVQGQDVQEAAQQMGVKGRSMSRYKCQGLKKIRGFFEKTGPRENSKGLPGSSASFAGLIS
jgi:RNA polymerase sigma factor (sigma-70 family)